MYSLLLMSAVAAGPDAASFGWRMGGSCNGCSGAVASCTGCYGSYSAAACYGSSCHGSACYGSSCNGTSCNGGGLFHGGLMDRLRAGRGSCTGCYGSGHGSCYGSCYGSSYGAGCYGSCYGSGCTGCIGSGCAGAVVVPDAGTAIPAATSQIPEAALPTTSSIAAPKASASLTIELPESAVLYVDGQRTAASGGTRQFHTPDLEAGQAFFYDFKAEVTVGGKVETEEKRVVVRAGGTKTESFAKLFAAVKAANASGIVVVSK